MEVDVDATLGPAIPTPRIEGNVVAVVEGTPTRVAPEWPEPDDVDRAIAAHVVRALPPSPTLQYGPGPLLDTIVRAIDRPVGVYSGLVTDAVAALAADGRLRAPAVTGYCGVATRSHALAADGRLRLAPLAETHDVARLTAIPQFVAHQHRAAGRARRLGERRTDRRRRGGRRGRSSRLRARRERVPRRIVGGGAAVRSTAAVRQSCPWYRSPPPPAPTSIWSSPSTGLPTCGPHDADACQAPRRHRASRPSGRA